MNISDCPCRRYRHLPDGKEKIEKLYFFKFRMEFYSTLVELMAWGVFFAPKTVIKLVVSIEKMGIDNVIFGIYVICFSLALISVFLDDYACLVQICHDEIKKDFEKKQNDQSKKN